MTDSTDAALARMMDEAEPAVRKAIQRSLRVSLRPSDSRSDNDLAFDCAQQARLDLIEKFRRVLGKEDEPVASVPDYAARVAYNVVKDAFRERDPDRARLKNRVRRFLGKQRSYGVWRDAAGRLLAGYAGWEAQRRPAASAAAARMRGGALSLDPKILPRSSWEAMDAREWDTLLSGLFDHLDGPLDLDRLVDLLGHLLGVVLSPPLPSLDELREATGFDPVEGTGPPACSPEHLLEQRELLRRVWHCMRSLRREWRLAVLLNPPSLRKDLRGELDVFIANGVATRRDIQDALELTDADFVSLGVAGGGDRGALFRDLWGRLPAPDAAIGTLFGKTAMQVIGLRKLGVRQVARCAVEPPGERGHTPPPGPSARGERVV